MSARPIDLTTCDREPIHLAGAIQPFGALLVLDGEQRLVRRSANVASVMGTLPEFGRPLAPRYARAFGHWFEQRPHAHEALEPVELGAPEHTLDVMAHRSGSGLLIELEPRAVDAPSPAVFAIKAQRALDRIQRQTSLTALLETATEELRNLTGFDRVMAYRFLHDDSGHVVAERRRADLETFLGLRYPATDIPVQARRLFTLNRLRFIPDIAYRPVPLEPDSGADAADPLDLSDTLLRSVSPVHVEYLRNMGVTGSMSVSIVVGGKLWGLFACHHYAGARLVAHAVRAACSLITQVVSVLVERIQMEERTRGLEAARTLREELWQRTRGADDLVQALTAAPSFVELVDASGGALFWERRVVQLGVTPPLEVMPVLLEWLRTKNEDVVTTHELGREAPTLAEKLAGTGGLLAVRVQRDQDGFLVWFRREEAETVRWAGNPEKT